jgi:hypothetical protein
MIIRRIVDTESNKSRFEFGFSGVSEERIRRIAGDQTGDEIVLKDSGLLVPTHVYADHPYAGTTRGGVAYDDATKVMGIQTDIEAPGLRAGQNEPDNGDYLLWYRGTDDSEDRHDSVINADGWITDHYEKPGAGVFLFAHDYSHPAIGRTEELKKTKKFMDFKIRFAVDEWDISGMPNMAKLIYRLAARQYMGGCSVGFIGIEEEILDETKDEFLIYYGMNVRYTKQELLELSAVPVGSNRNALARKNSDGLKRALTDQVVSENELTASGLGRMIMRQTITMFTESPLLKAIQAKQESRKVEPKEREVDVDMRSVLADIVAVLTAANTPDAETVAKAVLVRAGAVLAKRNVDRIMSAIEAANLTVNVLEEVLVDAGVDPETGDTEAPAKDEEKSVIADPASTEDNASSEFTVKGIFGDIGAGLAEVAANKQTGDTANDSAESGNTTLSNNLKLF